MFSRLSPRTLFAGGIMIAGCMANNVFLEYIVSDKRNPDADKEAGPLLTLLQFTLVIALTLPGQLEWKGSWAPTFKALKIPITVYIAQTVIFFTMSYLNNAAFAYNISQPTHMLFRSSSLIASLLVGFCLGERYSWRKALAVVGITVGVVVATLAEATMGDTASKAAECCDASTVSQPENYMATWWQGIIFLVLVIFLGVLLSHYQSRINKRHLPTSNETMFVTHSLSVLVFLGFSRSYGERIHKWNSSQPLSEIAPSLFGGFPLPIMWVYVVGNVITQFICAKGVHMLVSSTDAVTLTMFLTLRKFLSLLFSVVYFGNAFTLYHWLGAFAVFGGVAVYSNVK